MTKKETKEAGKDEVEHVPDQPLSEIPLAPQGVPEQLESGTAPEDEDDRYRVNVWNGYDVLYCNYCAGDFMGLGEFEDHWKQRHDVPVRQLVPVKVPIYDRFNNLIGEREV